MVLVDTSIWVDHLRSGDRVLVDLLDQGVVCVHPWVIGELALGNMRERDEVLGLLNRLPQAQVATAVEVLALIEGHRLAGTGIGYVDAQLLASTMLDAGTTLWSRDRNLHAVAARIGVAEAPTRRRR